MIDKVKPYAKFVAAVLGAVLTAGAQTLAVIPDDVRPWLTIVLVVATAISVYGVRNTDQTEQAN